MWVCVARLLGMAGSNPLETWISASCECCVLSGRGLCSGSITLPEESHRMWCVGVWFRNFNSGETMAHRGAVEPWIITWNVPRTVFIRPVHLSFSCVLFCVESQSPKTRFFLPFTFHELGALNFYDFQLPQFFFHELLTLYRGLCVRWFYMFCFICCILG